MAGEAYWVASEDWHTAGEPFRIVSALPAHCTTTGATVAERRRNILSTPGHALDALRQTLCHEPHGHADMYGAYIVPPDDEGAAFGVLFWHKDGFSTACGHGTIALGCWALASGRVQTPEGDGEVDVVIDVPSGRVTARVTVEAGRAKYVDFINVPSYQLSRTEVDVIGLWVPVDIAFGGATYACLPAASIGLSVANTAPDEFVKFGRIIKASVGRQGTHAGDDLYGVIFYEDFDEEGDDGEQGREVDDAGRNGDDEGDNGESRQADAANGSEDLGAPDAASRDPALTPAPRVVRQRNVTVYADGAIDRSPCGSGTAARVAILFAEGKMDMRTRFIHDSIVGTRFEAFIDSVCSSSDADNVEDQDPAGATPAQSAQSDPARQAEPVPDAPTSDPPAPTSSSSTSTSTATSTPTPTSFTSPTDFPACVPRIRGMAYLTGRHHFYIDPSDPIYPGFVLR